MLPYFNTPLTNRIIRWQEKVKYIYRSISYKLGCVVRMVVDSILPHAECGPNDNRKDAPSYKLLLIGVWSKVDGPKGEVGRSRKSGRS